MYEVAMRSLCLLRARSTVAVQTMISEGAKGGNGMQRTFLGYIMSITCVMFSFSRIALQLKQVMTFLASMPRSCVIGAGAGEMELGNVDAVGTRMGLWGNELPSELR